MVARSARHSSRLDNSARHARSPASAKKFEVRVDTASEAVMLRCGDPRRETA